MIQGKLNYNDMYVTKHFFINIYSKYTRPFQEQMTDDSYLRWFGGGGAKKN